VLPAASRLDLPQLRSLTGRPHLTLARENEFAALFPDCAPGALPPFGGLYGLGVYMDRALASRPDLVFEAGTHREEIRMPTTEFLRMERPVVASLRAA
jgi:Ala-tRNA(Pro) deacylase